MRKDLNLGCKAGSDGLNRKGAWYRVERGEEQERWNPTCFLSSVLGQPDLCTSCAPWGSSAGLWTCESGLAAAIPDLHPRFGFGSGISWSVFPARSSQQCYWCVDATWWRKPEREFKLVLPSPGLPRLEGILEDHSAFGSITANLESLVLVASRSSYHAGANW